MDRDTELTTAFDYTQLDSAKLARLQDLAQQGRIHLRRTKEAILAFGEVLLEAKAILPHGQFRAWAAAEFGIPDSTITYAMRKARGGDIELENVNINILPERAESKHLQGEEELEPLARLFFLDIAAIGQDLSAVKITFLQNGHMHRWEEWCSKGAKIQPAIAALYITVYEMCVMHPDKSPQQLLPSLAEALEITIGHLLLQQSKEDIRAICFHADWLHGLALLREGRPIDIPLDKRQDALQEAEEGLQSAMAGAHKE